MKALFRHVKLPVYKKNADATTYRDRINNALAYWFGECFAPGRAVVECNAPKILAAVVYLATWTREGTTGRGRGDHAQGVTGEKRKLHGERRRVTTKGVADDELRALFEGPSRIDRGYPRGLPLMLPNLDQLPPPIEGGVRGNGDGGDGRKTAAKPGGRVASRGGVGASAEAASPPRPAKGARSKRGGTAGNGNASGAGSNAGAKTPTPAALRATADVAEDAGETAGETGTVPRGRRRRDRRCSVPWGASPWRSRPPR